MIKLHREDILISLEDWVKYSINGMSYHFNKGKKYKVLCVFFDCICPYYIESEKIDTKNELELHECSLNENEITKNFDYLTYQRKNKLIKFKKL